MMAGPVMQIADVPDPRADCPGGPAVGVVAFYYPDSDTPWDTVCQAAFLGNFWNVSERVELEVPAFRGRRHRFRNAEAAFQATKHWQFRAREFENLTGDESFRKKREHEADSDHTYGGFGSNWTAMLAVLRAKYERGGSCAALLLSTGDTLLLEHNSRVGRDTVWSDNSDGSGTNWLGMQLMLIRDELTGLPAWTTYLANLVNLANGAPVSPHAKDAWQATVRTACSALKQALASGARPVPAVPRARPAPAVLDARPSPTVQGARLRQNQQKAPVAAAVQGGAYAKAGSSREDEDDTSDIWDVLDEDDSDDNRSVAIRWLAVAGGVVLVVVVVLLICHLLGSPLPLLEELPGAANLTMTEPQTPPATMLDGTPLHPEPSALA